MAESDGLVMTAVIAVGTYLLMKGGSSPTVPVTQTNVVPSGTQIPVVTPVTQPTVVNAAALTALSIDADGLDVQVTPETEEIKIQTNIDSVIVNVSNLTGGRYSHTWPVGSIQVCVTPIDASGLENAAGKVCANLPWTVATTVTQPVQQPVTQPPVQQPIANTVVKSFTANDGFWQLLTTGDIVHPDGLKDGHFANDMQLVNGNIQVKMVTGGGAWSQWDYINGWMLVGSTVFPQPAPTSGAFTFNAPVLAGVTEVQGRQVAPTGGGMYQFGWTPVAGAVSYWIACGEIGVGGAPYQMVTNNWATFGPLISGHSYDSQIIAIGANGQQLTDGGHVLFIAQ